MVNYYGWSQAPTAFDIDPATYLVNLFNGGKGNGGTGGYYYRADQGVFSDVNGTIPSTNGGDVQKWNDLSGNGNHLSVVTGTAPIYRNTVGHSIEVNGTKVLGHLNATTNHDNYILFIKVQGTGSTNSNGPRIMYEGTGTTASNDGFATTDSAFVGNWNTAKFAFWGYNQRTINATGGGGLTPPNVYCIVKEGTNMYLYEDNVLLTSIINVNSTNPSAGSSRILLGAGSHATSLNNFRPFTGRYGVVLKYETVMSSAQRAMICSILTKYDISL